ncbi:MAG: radical SAM protein [Planctomycetaceae bacterium]|nr:radical SAM protein [Planctomycetaceae bacterium]
MMLPTELDDRTILAERPDRHEVSQWEPYAFLVEDEHSPCGKPESVATLFLANRECPFRCLMCDLWKNTLARTVSLGAIPHQIEFALWRLEPAKHIKLYNSGNFFDSKAIPSEDHPAIATLVQNYETVIVENHPNLTGPVCQEFQRRIPGQLEVALGLETVHSEVLKSLNKRMTVSDFDRATEFLDTSGIAIRAFILLKPPFLGDGEAEEWCLRSIAHAFDHGARVCSIIPTRSGNGIMERLERAEMFSPPQLTSLERVCDVALRWNRGRVFVDLWDARKFTDCANCADDRIARLQRMNLTQQVVSRVECEQCGGSA